MHYLSARWVRLLDHLPKMVMCFILVYSAVAALTLAGQYLESGDLYIYPAKVIVGSLIFFLFGRSLIRQTLNPPEPEARKSLYVRIERYIFAALVGTVISFGLYALRSHFGESMIPGFRIAAITTDPIFELMMALWPFQAYAEETFFRGFLHNYIKERWNARTAVIAGSLIFTAAHLPNSLMQVALYAVMSVVITLVYEKFGSLSYSTVAHASTNMTAQAIVHWHLITYGHS